MIKHNELVIDGVRTSSFPFKVIVHDSPSIALGESKTALLEHGGISGAIVQTNKHRELVKKPYTIYLVKPTEEQMNQFMSLFIREKFWLESERVKTTRLWCYKVNVSDLEEVQPGLYMTKATFTCHPTKYFKTTDTQRLTRSGTLTVQGSALAFPKITIVGQSASETSFTIAGQVIRLERLTESLVMVNNAYGKPINAPKGVWFEFEDEIKVDKTRAERDKMYMDTGQLVLTETYYRDILGFEPEHFELRDPKASSENPAPAKFSLRLSDGLAHNAPDTAEQAIARPKMEAVLGLLESCKDYAEFEAKLSKLDLSKGDNLLIQRLVSDGLSAWADGAGDGRD